MSMRARLWDMVGKPALVECEKLRKQIEREKNSVIREKESHIRTVEQMLESNERRHVGDMKQINSKLDKISDAYAIQAEVTKQQSNEIATITKELAWQREDANEWRERLEVRMEMTGDGPATLLEIEQRLKEKHEQERSKKA